MEWIYCFKFNTEVVVSLSEFTQSPHLRQSRVGTASIILLINLTYFVLFAGLTK